MNGLLDGFKTGYGLMDNHYRNEDAKQFRDQQYGDQQTQRGIQNDRNKVLDGYAKTQSDQGTESHNANMANMGLQTQLNEKKLATYDVDKKRIDKTQDQTHANAELQGKFAEARLTAAQKQAKDKETSDKGMMLSNMIEAHKAGMEVDYDKFLEISNSVKDTQWGFLSDSLPQKQSVRALARDVQSGNITSETLQLLNNGGMPELKAAVGKPSRFGSPITDVAIASLEPTNEAGDKFAIRLLVRDEAGNVYQSAVNEGRDADSPLKELDADKIIQHLIAQNTILDEAEQSGILDKVAQHKAMQMQYQGNKPTALMMNDQYLRQNYTALQAENKLFRNKSPSHDAQWNSFFTEAMKAVSSDFSTMDMKYDEKMRIATEMADIEFYKRTQGQQGGQAGQQQQQPADPLSAQPNNNDPLGLGF
jgi:hypothetical protein